MAKVNKTIRGMDERTWSRAVVAALKANVTMADWLRDAIREKLNRRRTKKNEIVS